MPLQLQSAVPSVLGGEREIHSFRKGSSARGTCMRMTFNCNQTGQLHSEESVSVTGRGSQGVFNTAKQDPVQSSKADNSCKIRWKRNIISLDIG